MTAVDRLLPDTTVSAGVGLREAIVHPGDPLQVRLVGTGQRYVHGPVEYRGTKPEAGTRVLVAQSDVGRWWLIA